MDRRTKDFVKGSIRKSLERLVPCSISEEGEIRPDYRAHGLYGSPRRGGYDFVFRHGIGIDGYISMGEAEGGPDLYIDLEIDPKSNDLEHFDTARKLVLDGTVYEYEKSKFAIMGEKLAIFRGIFTGIEENENWLRYRLDRGKLAEFMKRYRTGRAGQGRFSGMIFDYIIKPAFLAKKSPASARWIGEIKQGEIKSS